MDINGTVDAGELAFTVELDTDDVWNEIEDQVYEAAREAAREAIDNADFNVDYADGASNLLGEYRPGSGCSLAREFESAVQGAVSVNDFLKDVVLEQVGEHTAGNVDDIGKIRAIVREEIRLALTTVASQLTSVV
jgi:hypothetical protein